MKLTELSPHWINENVFIFLCPHCRNIWLSCKNVAMPIHDQIVLFENDLGEDWNQVVVPMREDFAWSISSKDFETMTITPSIDASASGHWHGCITNGDIV